MIAAHPPLPGARSRPRVLTLTNMYPTPERPSYGCFVEAQVESLRKQGLAVDVHFIDGRTSRWAYARALRSVREKMRSGAYDLVHAHYGYSALYPLVLGKLPLIVTFHGSDVLIANDGGAASRRWLDLKVRDYVAAHADAVIVQTPEMRDALRGAAKPVRVIPMGIDIERFRPLDRAACRSQLGYEATERAALFPYDPARTIKGHDLAKAAMALVRRDVPGARLRVVEGADPTDMPVHYNAADCLLIASVREGSPNTIKEALACNLPVVSTDCGDAATMLDGVSGCRIAERTAASLAAGLLEVFSRPDPRSNGRASVASLDLRATAARIAGVYQEVLYER